jgi:hypothetical protein
LNTVFDCVESHVVSFFNPMQNIVSTNSVYVCVKA